MNSIGSIANSALQAFSTSQQITSNNIANLNSDGFTASRAAFQENRNGGVTATATRTEDSVDISREATHLITNSQNFKANLTTFKTVDEMTKELLSIKA
jgi:flagellar hook protein FlgE